MMNDTGLRRTLPDQSSGSGHTFGTPRHPSITDPILSKRVCFYKSGDPQFNGLRLVINNRTFKTFDALLDNLSKKVPLPFGVRNITTPRGVHAIYTLDELEDGKSYICSDSRKVKPINLALARKKLPPWYHARPVSSRRRTIQQARLFPGWSIHKQEPVVVRTPKRLGVFRNGDPTVKHTVVLQKRTTPTFKSVLEYISELIQFHVVKLHTLDGRRIDGLPGLILCSGTVVAAGREPFRPANYNAQKLPAPTRLSTNRKGLRRLKALNSKKKYPSYTSRARNFSPSSEKYIVNRINNSIAESFYNPPSNATNSVELESAHLRESVADTEGGTCLGDGAEGQDCLLPTEDDIEKSFRVNQDGSMTVEMRVRLTIKEEETIHWTTTVTRSSVANQLNETCLPESEQELCSPQSNSLDLQNPAASIDSINKDKSKDNNDEDPPSPSNGVFNESSDEEDNVKLQTDAMSPRRAPTPGCKHVRKKQASVESITSMTAEGIQEGMVGSYSYREQVENGMMTEQYCMVKQSTTRPVPKPRRLGSLDANTTNSRNASTFKSAEMTEILQIESSGEEVTETVLHIYEQQSCQDNFLANICTQGMSASVIPFDRPATSIRRQLSSMNEFEPELCRPFTASECTSNWRAERMSVISDFTLPSLKTGAIQTTNRQQQFPEPTTSKDKPQQRKGNKDKRISTKLNVVNKRVWQMMSSGKRPKKPRKKVKTFSSAGFIKRIYGNKSKSAKSMKKLKKKSTQNGSRGVTTTKSSQSLDDTVKSVVKDPNIPSQLKENANKTVSFETSSVVSQPKGILMRQTSMHREKENEAYDISKSMSLSGVNSSSSVTNEYVEQWLENAHHNPTAHSDGERKILNETENSMFADSGNNGGLIAVVEEVMCLEEKSETQTCQTLKSDPVTESLLATSIKLRIQSFENKSSIPLVEKTTATQQIGHGHVDTTKTENSTSVAQHNTEKVKPFSNGICSEINPLTNKLSTEMPSGSESSPVKISRQKAILSGMLSVEKPLPLPPPPADNTELSNSEYCMMDVSPMISSPLDKLSSVSSQMPDNHPLSISPASDKAVSPTDHTKETTASVQTDIPPALGEAPLPRTQSIKRAPLVSNLSLERKMSLRKACLDKYTLCSDATSETPTSSPPINTLGDNVLSNGICLTGTQQPSKTLQDDETQKSILDLMSNPSCCTSASPTSLTSDERTSSVSISSSEAPTPSNLPFKEMKMPLSMQEEVPSPKPSVKKVKIMSSPSPEKKPQTKKLLSDFPNSSPKVSSIHNHPSHNTVSHNIGIQKHATPNASPATEKKLTPHKPKLQKRPSPYSQSLDMASPPVRHKSVRKMLSRNLSSDNASEPTTKTQRNTSSQRKRNQTPQLFKSKAKLDKTMTCETVVPEGSQIDTAKVTDGVTHADQEISMTGTQKMPQPLNIANQPNMKPVLDKVCFSIKSIRQITQNKRPSCLEKSNSLPDFSSHVASTFGSSSKVLLAFLSVITLKECITNFNMDKLNANNVSCAEALKMIDSLREIASIEDSQKLKCSLSDLQQSASKQLLQSWRGFQELSDKCRSHSSTSNNSEHGLITESSLEKDCSIEENVITKLMDNLDIPEKLKKELDSLSVGIKSESDDEEKMSTSIIRKLSLNENSDVKVSQSSTEDTVRDITQDEMANVDVSCIIKKFVDTNPVKQPNMDSVAVVTQTAKHEVKEQSEQTCPPQRAPCRVIKPTDQETKEDNQNVVAKCPPAEPKDKQIPEERQLKKEENREAIKSSRVVVNEGNEHQGYTEDKSNQGIANIGKKYLEKQNCSSDTEKQDIECRQLHNYCNESGSDEEGQKISSANNDVEEKDSCKESVSSSDVGEQHSSEEDQPEVECEGSECDPSTCEGHLEEEEEHKQSSLNYYVELNFSRKESITSRDSNALSNPASPPNPEKEQGIQKLCMGLNVSVDKSTDGLDVDERPSEDEQPETKCQQLKIRIEESLKKEQESVEEEEHLDLPAHEKEMKTCKKLQILTEETEEGMVRPDDNTKSQNAVGGEQSIFIENLDLYTKNNNSSLTKSDSLSKHYRFDADEDSRNDHNSCEEQVEMEKPKINDQQISSSIAEKLSYYEKESRLEKEHANMDRHMEENYCKDHAMATETEDTKCEKAVEKHQSEETMSQSVAERVSLLEKQVAEAQRRKYVTESSAIRHFSQRNLESDVEDSPSESPTSQPAICTRSAPHSSLSFSYDSSGIITTEPEGNRVRSIREMFLAKSAKDIQHGNRHFPSPNASEVSQLRAQTSASGGYQSQASSELSSGEDDSAQKSISKGFVRRTIERLYGKKDANPDREASERPPSAPKQKKKEHSSIFSPFHTVRSKAMSEVSYFNSTNALDTLSEATRCIAFNAQVGPGDSVPLDDKGWLLKENTLMRKSVSDPVGINKTFTSSAQGKGGCEDTEESSPYSLFSTKPEQEDKKTFSRKCTYFSLPYASDSDVCQDDQSTVSKSSVNSDIIADAKDKPEETKMWTERNTTLPAGGVTDFKMLDNKVHPLIEGTSDSEAVVVQPGKGQGVMNRRLQEPDMLDFLYNFCGQHCPIL